MIVKMLALLWLEYEQTAHRVAYYGLIQLQTYKNMQKYATCIEQHATW